LKILEEGSQGRFNIYISPVSLLELTLILRSRGVKDQDIALAMEAIEYAIKKYVKPNYPPLDIAANVYVARLRTKYHELTYFDSLHASIAMLNKLVYYDLDDVIKRVIAEEIK